MDNKILIIAGPTAVGKTSISIQLAKRLNGEIVSADSMQIYKGLDVGTAKPTLEERENITHYLMDVCDPDLRFSVAQYVALATDTLNEIISRGKLPIVVGGTGLYIDNLIYSNDFGKLDINLSIREELNNKAKIIGGKGLLEELRKIDFDYSQKLHENDIKRIVHALEIYYSTGKTQSQIIAESRKTPPKFKSLYAVLDCSSRELLYERINNRVDVMMESGLLDEARRVINADWYEGSTASQAIGYKEFEGYFRNESTLEDCISLLKQRSRNYAKRQLTWFRHKEEAKFYYVDVCDNVIDAIIADFNKLEE